MIVKVKAMNVLSNMLDRCYVTTNHAYKNYGGRGIKVCDEWLNDPTTFLLWYEARYFEKGQVDRIDVNEGYSPNNCRVVTAKENSRNRRNTRMLTAFGETKSYGEWVEDARAGSGLTISAIVARAGNDWISEDIVTKPVSKIRGQSPDAPLIPAFGESKTLHEWANDDRCVVSKHCLWQRMKNGWGAEKAMTAPTAKNAGQLYEGKSVLQWSKDPACEVSYKVLNARLKKGIPLTTALRK